MHLPRIPKKEEAHHLAIGVSISHNSPEGEPQPVARSQ